MDATRRHNMGMIGGRRALTREKEMSFCGMGFPRGSFPRCGLEVEDIANMDTEVTGATVSDDGATEFCTEWESPAMRGVQSLMAEIASTDIPLLVVGEAGVGKEAIAAQLHRMSPRRDGLLRRVGCASLNLGDF